MTAPFAVVVPAHNEAAVIERCLGVLLADAPPSGRPEIVVVCNGCSDDTAARARAVEGVVVIELEVGSKPLALNAGLVAVSARPVFFVDADIVVSFEALAAAAAALAEPGVMAAAPRLRADLEGCSWPVRAYYKVWQALPYVREGLVGSGVYGLSVQGISVLGRFPDVIADDAYVRSRFAPRERRSVQYGRNGREASFRIFPPRTVRDLIRVEARRRRGDAQLGAFAAGARAGRATTADSIRNGLFRGFSLFDLAIYLSIKSAGRFAARLDLLRGRDAVWLRDESSRRSASV